MPTPWIRTTGGPLPSTSYARRQEPCSSARGMRSSVEAREINCSHFDDQWRSGIEIAIPQPARTHAHVDQARPREAVPPVRKHPEVLFPKFLQLGTRRSVGLAFVLHRLLFAPKASDHERDAAVLLEVSRFAGSRGRV